jgi:hypothetical protein
VVSRSFANMPVEIFDKYDIKERGEKLAKFRSSSRKWNEWIEKNPELSFRDKLIN